LCVWYLNLWVSSVDQRSWGVSISFLYCRVFCHHSRATTLVISQATATRTCCRFWKGLLAVWIGGAIGQAFAFLLARYLLRDWVEATLRGKWKRWEVIDRAISHDGWKLVLIMRMSPIIPYNLLNIAMATTSMPFWQVGAVPLIG
jgi:membrane protein DedA with SNARE-associated domain